MFKFKINTIILISILFSIKIFPQEFSWELSKEIEKSIIEPSFKGEEYSILDYGAVGDGKYDCTEAIKKAIDICNSKGGGSVIIPAGTFLTGAIYLKSNVNLHLSKDAKLKFSTETEKYLPLVLSRWEGVECMNYSALIYANNEKNIAITGEGVLDGQANNENWWWWKGLKEYGWNDSLPNQKKSRDKLFKMNEENIPVDKRIMGKGEYLRPNFVQFYNCENILIRGVEFKDSPMWFINPVLCKNITIKGVKIEGLGPNNDGCNPESCENVLISDCFFNTGDDCIAIKSGRNNDGRRIGKPSENIIIKNCKMKEGHGGVVIGSEISGGVRNIFVENCEMDSPNLDRAIRIKTNSIRGGFVENLYARNIKIGVVKEAVLKINFYYEEGDSGEYTPSVKNIILENITSQKSDYALWIRAYERSKVAGLRIENCRFENVSNGSVLENVEVPIYKNYFVNCKLVE
jgi:polygalacturonase